MSNLPIKQEKNIILKIKNFFRNLFYKQQITQEETIEKVDIIEQDAVKNNFENNIKIQIKDDYSKKIKRDEFIRKIEKNPNLLYELSNDRLEKLEVYYDKLIEEDNLELAKLKKIS